jgi:hypothetical protein
LTTVTSIYELRACSNLGIFAIPYRAGRPREAIRLPDGAIVEMPLPDQRGDAPSRPMSLFEVGAGGVPATIHHANLGLITGYASLAGIYLLPSGEVAAVYGAEAIPIEADAPTAR